MDYKSKYINKYLTLKGKDNKKKEDNVKNNYYYQLDKFDKTKEFIEEPINEEMCKIIKNIINNEVCQNGYNVLTLYFAS